MPCVNSFFNYELSMGARIAAFYTILLSCPMFGMGVWHIQSSYSYGHFRSRYSNHDYFADSQTRVEAMGNSYLTFSVLFLLTSVCLLLGIHKKNHQFTWPWLVIILFAMVYFMIRLIIHGFSRQTLSIAEQILMFFGIFIMGLFYIVVISYKQRVKKLYTSQVAITTNQPEMMQPHQYTQIPTIDGNNLHPLYIPAAYPSNPQPPINIPTSSNSVPPVHFPPQFYPPPTQSNSAIEPPNPAFYPQSYIQYGPYPSPTYPVPLNPPNPQSTPNNSSIPTQAPYNPSIPPTAPYDSSIPPLQFLQQPYRPENAPAFPNSSPPAPY